MDSITYNQPLRETSNNLRPDGISNLHPKSNPDNAALSLHQLAKHDGLYPLACFDPTDAYLNINKATSIRRCMNSSCFAQEFN